MLGLVYLYLCIYIYYLLYLYYYSRLISRPKMMNTRISHCLPFCSRYILTMGEMANHGDCAGLNLLLVMHWHCFFSHGNDPSYVSMLHLCICIYIYIYMYTCVITYHEKPDSSILNLTGPLLSHLVTYVACSIMADSCRRPQRHGYQVI